MQNTQNINIILRKRSENKKYLTDFVKNQFKQLIKKNLSIPVTLYHL